VIPRRSALRKGILGEGGSRDEKYNFAITCILPHTVLCRRSQDDHWERKAGRESCKAFRRRKALKECLEGATFNPEGMRSKKEVGRVGRNAPLKKKWQSKKSEPLFSRLERKSEKREKVWKEKSEWKGKVSQRSSQEIKRGEGT